MANKINRISEAVVDSVEQIKDAAMMKIESKAEKATLFVIKGLSKFTTAAVNFLDKKK